MTRFDLTLAVALAIGAATPAGAQPMGPGGLFGFPGRPAFMESLFPPQVVMRYQEKLGLSQEQRTAISATIAETQSKTVGLRGQSEVAAQKLTKLLRAHPIDAAQALTQLDEMLRLEQQLRRANLAMLIAIRNTLTAEQQETLATLRPKKRPRDRRATRRPAPSTPAPER
jgi:Spy/CpxP family protein refolding chaperone